INIGNLWLIVAVGSEICFCQLLIAYFLLPICKGVYYFVSKLLPLSVDMYCIIAYFFNSAINIFDWDSIMAWASNIALSKITVFSGEAKSVVDAMAFMYQSSQAFIMAVSLSTGFPALTDFSLSKNSSERRFVAASRTILTISMAE